MPKANLTRGNSITEDIGNEDRQAYHEAVSSVLKEQQKFFLEQEDRFYFFSSSGMEVRNPREPFVFWSNKDV